MGIPNFSPSYKTVRENIRPPSQGTEIQSKGFSPTEIPPRARKDIRAAEWFVGFSYLSRTRPATACGKQHFTSPITHRNHYSENNISQHFILEHFFKHSL